MPTMAYIEDKNTRLTVVTGSPLGCSSLKPGQMEIMLDRRLKQDDNLGLGQGVLDNVPVREIFRILLERKTHSCQVISKNKPFNISKIHLNITFRPPQQISQLDSPLYPAMSRCNPCCIHW